MGRGLKHAEQALGRREGRGWLDAHRYSIQALDATDRQSVALGCRSLLRMFLRDFPDRSALELDDGTAAADAKTRLWLESEGLLGRDRAPPNRLRPPGRPSQPPLSRRRSPCGRGQIEVTAEAAALADSGRGADAVILLERAMAAASSGRDRFLLELHLAEICLRLGSDQVALAFLEDLERQIDGFRLEEWEHRELCARVFATLYHCLKEGGAGRAAPTGLRTSLQARRPACDAKWHRIRPALSGDRQEAVVRLPLAGRCFSGQNRKS